MGADHPDVGATCADLADALDFLLGAAHKQLFAAFPKWGDFPKASKVLLFSVRLVPGHILLARTRVRVCVLLED